MTTVGILFVSSHFTLDIQNPAVIPGEDRWKGTPRSRASGDVWGSKHILTRY